jgi:hypothetical protein
MFNVCKNCGDLRCGNHALCSLRKSSPSAQRVLPDMPTFQRIPDTNWIKDTISLIVFIGLTEATVQRTLTLLPDDMRATMDKEPMLMSLLRMDVAQATVKRVEIHAIMKAFGF